MNILHNGLKLGLEMRVCLQICGGLRTFDKCMSRLVKILRDNNIEYDCIFLIDRQEKENYSIDNEKLLFEICGNENIKYIRYADEFDDNYREEIYRNMVEESRVRFIKDIFSDGFIHRLLARRKIVNDMRKEYQEKNDVTYDCIFRGRFDILINDLNNNLHKCFTNNANFVALDTTSIATPEIIDYESSLGDLYPLCDERIFDNDLGFTQWNSRDPNTIYIHKNSWTYSAEFQLYYHYFLNKNININFSWLQTYQISLHIQR